MPEQRPALKLRIAGHAPAGRNLGNVKRRIEHPYHGLNRLHVAGEPLGLLLVVQDASAKIGVKPDHVVHCRVLGGEL
jgi:hypothetical protein